MVALRVLLNVQHEIILWLEQQFSAPNNIIMFDSSQCNKVVIKLLIIQGVKKVILYS